LKPAIRQAQSRLAINHINEAHCHAPQFLFQKRKHHRKKTSDFDRERVISFEENGKTPAVLSVVFIGTLTVIETITTSIQDK